MSNEELASFITASEDQLMARVLDYAKQQDYTRYTSTLVEAWRLSISGLSAALVDALSRFEKVPELQADESFEADAMSAFGMLEAERHRKRGVSLAMFLGLFKYYRQAYLDQIADTDFGAEGRLWIDRCFDRMEIGFVVAWSQLGKGDELSHLQQSNRAMTNEKNRLLTVVESLSSPAILVDDQDRVLYRNSATAALTQRTSGYYQSPVNPFQEQQDPSFQQREPLAELVPWLCEALAAHKASGKQQREQEISVGEAPDKQHYVVQLSSMRDVSGKYPGTVILVTDVTARRRAEDRIRSLEGILPICASCKKIRDAEQRWVAVETYVRDHSHADFSHGICPDCCNRLYPDVSK